MASSGPVGGSIPQTWSRPEEEREQKNYQRKQRYCCIYTGKFKERRQLKSRRTPSNMDTNKDLSDFERGMIVGLRRTGRSISETVDMLGFSRTAVSQVYREWCEKTPGQRQAGGAVRAEKKKTERVVKKSNQTSSEQIQTVNKSSGAKASVRRSLKRSGYSHRGESQGDLTLARLEALAAYTSRLEKMETSTEHVSTNKDEPAPSNEAITDPVSSNDSALDLTRASSEVSVQ